MEWRPLNPGETFEDRYRIENVLGIGGFAHVYRATQMDLDRDVALKVLRPVDDDDEGAAATDEKMERWVRRFKREAKVIADLRDPHTITMYDYGHTDSGMLYMVFEHISGRSLKEIIEKDGPIAPDRVVAILRQCLSSLQEAHATGILHRDVKPANVMVYDHVGRRDQVKVLDFGIAKPIMDQGDATSYEDLTQEGKIIGTPRYMAPEQLLGEGNTGPHSDVYGLGLVVYELLFGQPAVTGPSTMMIISKQVSPDPIEIPQRPDIPRRLYRILEKMVEKDVADRFGTADEILELLEPRTESGVSTDADTGIPASADGASTADEPDGKTLADLELEPIDDLDVDPTAAVDQSTESSDSDPSVQSNGIRPIAVAVIVGIVVVGGLATLVVVDGLGPGDAPADTSQEGPVSEEPTAELLNEATAEVATSVATSATASSTVTVETDPAGAELRIDGEPIGSSPVEIDLDKHSPPLDIRAELEDGRQLEETVDDVRPRIDLEFDEAESDAVAGRPDPPSPSPSAPSRSPDTDEQAPSDAPGGGRNPDEREPPVETAGDEPNGASGETTEQNADEGVDAPPDGRDETDADTGESPTGPGDEPDDSPAPDDGDEEADDDHGFVPLD